MNLSKSTLKFAAKRGLELVPEADGRMSVFWNDEDSEPLFFIRSTASGFFYSGNVYLPQEVKQELPHWMADEKRLRFMLNFVSVEMTARQ